MQIFFLVLAAVVGALVASMFASKPAKPKAAALDEFDLPTAEDGRPIPVAFGSCWSNDANVLWYGDLRTTPIKSKSGK